MRAETWKRSRPTDAALIQQIADQPTARWFGDWITNVGREVNQAVSTISGSGAAERVEADDLVANGLVFPGGSRPR